ncbi:DUF883 family protein [Telmatospirillum siberiense]|uniref:DUF883 domain-containing protein n=1 Tax=Telmatospirillum siberiense TaxID=382514 RepID=A0A2N3PRI2_9PROT|nr:hypothetical protein [Telmatospirillum siberiense]PKU23009.1 hypothetical protein CWS72_18380 [Telmatospirillum siberiense]
MSDNSVRNEFDSLRADFSQMRDDVASLTKAIGEMTAQEATDRLGDLKQAGKSARRQFNKAVDGADSLCQSGVTAIERQIDERPLVVMALAFGIGLLIGNVAHRR